MIKISLSEAKNRLSELVTRVQTGEVFTITRRGKAVALLGSEIPNNDRDKALDAIAQLKLAKLNLGKLVF